MTLNEWIISRDVGISSKTMWAAITGTRMNYPDRPYDPADFGRCIRFVRACNISRKQLRAVKGRFPWFAPYIDNWDTLASLWDEESPSGYCPKLYDFMVKLGEKSKALRV